MASELGNLENSIHYRIWGILRQTGWFTKHVNKVLMVVSSDDTPSYTYGLGDEQPWMFLGEDGLPTRNNVAVYVGGAELSRETYRVNYERGIVTLETAPTGPVTADFYRSAVRVRQGYPTDEELEQAELPLVAWDVSRTEGEGFGIGTALQDRTSFCSIDILGTGKGDRTDLTDNLYRFITWLPLYSFKDAQMLTRDYDIDPNFDPERQFWTMARMSHKPRASNIPPRQKGSDKERFRGLIAFEVSRVN